MAQKTWEGMKDYFAIQLHRGTEHPWAIHAAMIMDLIDRIKDLPEFNEGISLETSHLNFFLTIDGQYPRVCIWGEDIEHYGVAMSDQLDARTLTTKQEIINVSRDYLQRLREVFKSEF